jgi:hypothetical protein
MASDSVSDAAAPVCPRHVPLDRVVNWEALSSVLGAAVLPDSDPDSDSDSDPDLPAAADAGAAAVREGRAASCRPPLSPRRTALLHAAASTLSPDGEGCVADCARLCTVLVTTSPVRCHPSTMLIDALYKSLHTQVAGAADCPVLISCDAYVLDAGARYSNKMGHLAPDRVGACCARWRSVYVLCLHACARCVCVLASVSASVSACVRACVRARRARPCLDSTSSPCSGLPPRAQSALHARLPMRGFLVEVWVCGFVRAHVRVPSPVRGLL